MRHVLEALPSFWISLALLTSVASIRVSVMDGEDDEDMVALEASVNQDQVALGAALTQQLASDGNNSIKTTIEDPCAAFGCQGGRFCGFNYFLIDTPKGGTELNRNGTDIPPGTLVRTDKCARSFGCFAQATSRWSKHFRELHVYNLKNSESALHLPHLNGLFEVSHVYSQQTFDGVSSIQVSGCAENPKSGFFRNTDNGYALHVRIKSLRGAFTETFVEEEGEGLYVTSEFPEVTTSDFKENVFFTDVDASRFSFTLQGRTVEANHQNGLVNSLTYDGSSYSGFAGIMNT